MEINNIVIIGRLAKDPVSSQAGQSSVCKFTVANGEKEHTSFFDVVAWGKLGEICQKFLSKGSQVAIQGRLKQDRWEKDGQKSSRVLIIADNVQFLAKAKGDNKQSSDDEVIDFKSSEDNIPF